MEKKLTIISDGYTLKSFLEEKEAEGFHWNSGSTPTRLLDALIAQLEDEGLPEVGIMENEYHEKCLTWCDPDFYHEHYPEVKPVYIKHSVYGHNTEEEESQWTV